MKNEGATLWGAMLDCDKEGCDPRHADHGEVIPASRFSAETQEQQARNTVKHGINGHAATLVTCQITPWEPVEDQT